MWAIRTTGWILGIILTAKFFGLRYSAWLLSALIFFIGICVTSMLVRAGINRNNRFALWLNCHTPSAIQRAGMMLSETYPQRVLFWVAIFVIGYQFRDLQAYQEYTQQKSEDGIPIWTVTDEKLIEGYGGKAFELLLADGKTVVPNFIPCEDIGLRRGMRIKQACYYRKPDCSSFRGPRACIVKQ